jgi:eukaryotic-like serine/threonine-protein kinase
MPEHVDPLFLDFQSAVAGRYSLDRELGRGGMGIVYLAHDVRLDRPIAIKVLPPNLAAQPDLRERFMREARTSAKLSHPHIVPIHAVDEVESFVFFVMAFVEGETLGQRVRSRGPLSPSEAVRVLREVAWALAYAHAQGVVHRDVKPDNIMLETKTGRAMVTDFGIARQAQAPGITGKGEVVGTPEFMSPEQACGDEVDGRSDLYSLGVVGYFTLSGRLPFHGNTVAALLGQHLTQPPPPLPARGLPRRLTEAIDRCLAKEAARRYQTGEEMADAIAQVEETRREIPVAIRVFLRKTQNIERSLGGYAFLSAIFIPSFLAALVDGEMVTSAILGGIAGLALVLPPVLYLRNVRKLMRQGYERTDLLISLQTDVDRNREEIAFERDLHPSKLEKWLSRITYGAFGVGIACLVTSPLFRLVFGGSTDLLWEVFGVSLGVALLTGVPAGIMAQNRLVPGARRLKFWKGRFGDLVFRIAGWALKRTGIGAGAHRPTEVAIGLAADQLFESLPKETKRALQDLPDVLKRLQDDAQKMRARVEQLTRMANEAESGQGGGTRGVADQRTRLVTDLKRARDAAQERLGQAVAALEAIRLDLLRMNGGVGSVASLTEDLAKAKDVGEEIDRLLAGRREVEALLQE